MGVWDTPMYGIDDESTAAAGERGARWGGRIRDARAYRRAGQDRFSLDDASAVLAGGQGPVIDERARMGAVARSRAEVGDIAGRNEIVDQQNQEINQGLNQASARTRNTSEISGFAVNLIRSLSSIPEPERRRAMLERYRQRFIDANFTPEQYDAAIAGLTGPDAAQWEQEIIRGFTQAPEPQVSEQTGDIYTIDPVTQSPTVTGQVPGADMIRRGAEADVATQERAARAPYPRSGGGQSGGRSGRLQPHESRQITRIQTAAEGARGLQGLTQQFNDYLQVQDTGPGAGIQIWDPEVRAMTALAARMTGLMRPMGAGATSDFEQRIYARGAPSIDNTRAANMEIISGIETLAQIADARQFFYENFIAENGTTNGAEQAFQQSPEFLAFTGQQTAAPPPHGDGIGLEHLSDEELDALEQELTNGGR